MGGVERLAPDKRNANRGTVRGRALLEDSLRRYGAGRSILADKHGNIIAGNKTLEASVDIGLPVRFVETDGTELVVVQRRDLDLDGEDARALAYLDNRVAELDLDWDVARLLEDRDTGLDLAAVGFSDAELAELLAGADTGTEGLTDPDAVPGVPEVPVTQPGDLWVLGRHRLLCGDSTVATDVERLLDGARPELMVTDPPYGVDYEAGWRDGVVGEFGNGARIKGPVANDGEADWREAWALFPGSVAYVWHAGVHSPEVAESLQSSRFSLRSQIIWLKQHFAISRGHYHWMHEPCWCAVKDGATAGWAGDRKQTTVWEIASLNPAGRQEERVSHPTQKPIECMARPIRNHAGNVYDPFGGSGTTIIAAETTGRTCYMMELSPAYCDVIVTRWQQFTGQEARRA